MPCILSNPLLGFFIPITIKSWKFWQRERDSNPRYACAYSGFRDRPIQPLWHLSIVFILEQFSDLEHPNGHRTHALAHQKSTNSFEKRLGCTAVSEKDPMHHTYPSTLTGGAQINGSDQFRQFYPQLSYSFGFRSFGFILVLDPGFFPNKPRPVTGIWPWDCPERALPPKDPLVLCPIPALFSPSCLVGRVDPSGFCLFSVIREE